MSSCSSPILLRNLHCSLPTIARLYREATAVPESAPRGDLTSTVFPLETSTAAQGEELLDFFRRELGMGAASLRHWRNAVTRGMRRRWWGECAEQNAMAGLPSALSPSTDDVLFVRSSINKLKVIISPLLTLAQSHSRKTHSGSSFVATRDILPGVFLLSVPTSAIFFSSPPHAADPLTSYFMHVEDLVGQLVAVDCVPGSIESPPSHAGYVDYLKRSVTPCNNLPFLEMSEVMQVLKGMASAVDVGSTVGDSGSPALQLWEYFHRDMEGLPLSDFLRQRLTREEYAWWVSLVLSRRAGAATLIPVVDKLNHDPEPNCYYTMATDESFCGIDVFDNLLAGVDSELLYEPYLHTFSIREIKKGEELTLCYASPTTSSKKRGTAGGDGMSVRHSEGRAAWQLQWGFVPSMDSPYTSADLLEVATIVAERRVDIRQKLFPS